MCCTGKWGNQKKKKRLLRLDKYDFEDFSEDNFSKKIESGIISKTFGEPHFIIPFTDKYLNSPKIL